jgi:hypothetical protein
MKTYFEITADKTYRDLTQFEKALIQERQTALAIAWQDETNQLKRLEIEDELMASFTGLIKGMAYRQAEKSFSLDQEEFEGIISLAFAETLIDFDRTLNKPFQPVFITMVRYAILEMYREKGYDLHDTAAKLDSDMKSDANTRNLSGTSRDDNNTKGNIKAVAKDLYGDTVTMVVMDDILDDLFGEDDVKKTIVHMTVQNFKRNEIVSAIIEEGKSTSSVEKKINRTVTQFKEHYLKLQSGNLL